MRAFVDSAELRNIDCDTRPRWLYRVKITSKMRTWRNWQTRKIQVLVSTSSCRFKSCCPHQTRIKRTETIRFVFSYLGLQQDLWQCKALSAHSVCPCTLCSWRFTSANKFARFAITLVLLATSPVVRTKKRQPEMVVFFYVTADLKQNYVLSANGTAFVCPCTQQTWLTKECID